LARAGGGCAGPSRPPLWPRPRLTGAAQSDRRQRHWRRAARGSGGVERSFPLPLPAACCVCQTLSGRCFLFCLVNCFVFSQPGHRDHIWRHRSRLSRSSSGAGSLVTDVKSTVETSQVFRRASSWTMVEAEQFSAVLSPPLLPPLPLSLSPSLAPPLSRSRLLSLLTSLPLAFSPSLTRFPSLALAFSPFRLLSLSPPLPRSPVSPLAPLLPCP